MNKKVKVVLIVLLVIALMAGMFFLGQYLVNSNNKVTNKEEEKSIEKNEIKNSVNKKEEKVKDDVKFSVDEYVFNKELPVFDISYDGKNIVTILTEYKDGNFKDFKLADYQGKLVDNTLYDSISEFKYDNKMYYEVSKNDKFGLIDSKGNIILDIKYDYIQQISEGKENGIRIEQGKKFAMVTIKNDKAAVGKFYDTFYLYANNGGEEFTKFKYGYSPIIVNGKLGYIDLQGNEIIKPQYSVDIEKTEKLNLVNVGTFSEYDPPVVMKTKKGIYFAIFSEKDGNVVWGLSSKEGKVILPAKYNSLHYNKVTDTFIVTTRGITSVENVYSVDYTNKIVYDFKKVLEFSKDSMYHYEETDNVSSISIYSDNVFVIKDEWYDDYIIFDKNYNIIYDIFKKKYENTEKRKNYLYINEDSSILFYDNIYLLLNDEVANIYDLNKNKILSNIQSYEIIYDENDKKYLVAEGKIYTTEGKVLINKTFNHIAGIHNDLIYVLENSNINIYKDNGEFFKTIKKLDSDYVYFSIEKISNTDLMYIDISTNERGSSKMGIIDSKGNIKIDLNYYYLEYINNNFILSSKSSEENTNIINLNENKIKIEKELKKDYIYELKTNNCIYLKSDIIEEGNALKIIRICEED